MPPRILMPTLLENQKRTALRGSFVARNTKQMTKPTKAIVLGALLFVSFAVVLLPRAHGAGLGRLSVHSELGQPLSADVEVPAVGRDEAPSLQVRLATPAAFKQANLEFNPALTQLRFDLEARADGTYVVHITSAQAVNEPYLDLLLELTWSSGRVLREYTVLLDPPGLHQAPQIIAPTTAPAPEVAQAPAQTQAAAPAPEPVPAPAPSAPPPVMVAPSVPAPQPVPQMSAPPPAPVQQVQRPAPVAATGNVHVKTGDTLSKIALDTKAPSVSLDQMLVALLQANPSAFINGNMNLLRSGADLSVPSVDTAGGVNPTDAHKEVAAQSADFAAYRSRLAQATVSAPPVPEKQAAAAGSGKVTAKVEDKSAAQKSGDQLKIAKADAAAKAAVAAAAKKDEEVAKQRALKDAQERAAALAKANEDLKKANELAAKQAAAKAAADKAAADKAAADKAASDKLAAARAAADKAAADKAAAEKAAADKQLAAAKAAADKAAADKAAADRAAAEKATAAKTAEAPKPAEVTKVEGPKLPAPAGAPPADSPTILDTLTDQPLLLGGAAVGLLVLLVALGVWRRSRRGGGDQFKVDGDPMAANSLFGAAGGQSVDTGATSTFNSSFIPAASQLDSNEVDPVAEADVYVAYGREEQAEDILKEALRLQPDRHAVRVKLLEIYSRRGDTASFNAVAQELHDRTGGVGEDWDRAAKMGKSLEPTNPLYAGASGGDTTGVRGPVTDLRLGTAAPPLTAPTGPTVAAVTRPGNTDLDFDTMQHMVGDKTKLMTKGGSETVAPDTQLAPETTMPAEAATANTASSLLGRQIDSKLGFGADTTPGFGSTQTPTLVMPPPTIPGAAAGLPPAAPAGGAPRAPAPATIDFGALDFDLGPSKLNIEAQTELPVEKEEQDLVPATVGAIEPPTIPSLDLMFPPTTPGPKRTPAPATVSGSVPIPNIDLNLPPTTLPPRTSDGHSAPGTLEEALSRPTLVGAVGALSESDVPRLNSNTDQATVPLIDFDLTGADAALTGRRTETQAGSPMASQMATKLDLARGYIDLGVKDGARELLEEVMKDGTREQRQQAVELIKLVEA